MSEDDDFEPIAARQALLRELNRVEDAYAQHRDADAVFAIMQAKQDLGLPIHREGAQ